MADDLLPAFWCGWYSHLPLKEFELHSPWWVTGWAADEDGDFSVPTMVAAVRASDSDAASEIIRNAYDDPPEDVEWRWAPEPLDGTPFSDRFPQNEWMAWESDGRTCNCGEHRA